MLYSKNVTLKLEENIQTMQYIFHADCNKDLIVRQFRSRDGRNYCLFCLDGMSSQSTISEFVMKPIMECEKLSQSMLELIQLNSCTTTTVIDEAVTAILGGDTAVFENGCESCLICETKGFEQRSVSTPSNEVIIKGSQESFSEGVRTNITLVRKIIRTPQLCTEFINIGDANKGVYAIMYIDDIVNKQTLDKVRERLHSLKGDYIIGSGMIEQLIEDEPFSLFPSILSTERPDRVSSYLSSGRIAIICDGSPFVIIVPITIALLLDSPEGTSQRWTTGTFSRIMRLFALFFTTMLSGVYLAVIMFHREMIPTQLIGAIVAASSNIPFPTILEVLLMELFFDLVREAGLRTPKAAGGAIGIVGALILGQAAVTASLVSPVTLIVVALSGLGNSVMPDYDLAFGLRSIKLIFIALGTTMGFLGISVGFILVLSILANQHSFGVPMLSFQAIKWSSGGPVFFQWPIWKQQSRPRELKPQKVNQYPTNPRKWVHEEKE